MQFILQSPKTKLRSAPVDETDTTRLAWLQEKGWKIVQRIGEEPAADGGADAKASAVIDALPDDFPCRELLLEAGLATVGEVKAVPDLTEINGVGPGRARAILGALAAMEQAAP